MLELNCNRPKERRQLDFKSIADLALAQANSLVPRWLPDGRQQGREWIALNPTREDRQIGSFSVNLRTGCWADFATGDAGGDLIALRAFLDGSTQGAAARRVAQEVGQ